MGISGVSCSPLAPMLLLLDDVVLSCLSILTVDGREWVLLGSFSPTLLIFPFFIGISGVEFSDLIF